MSDWQNEIETDCKGVRSERRVIYLLVWQFSKTQPKPFAKKYKPRRYIIIMVFRTKTIHGSF